MPLQVRRGPTADRLSIIPVIGEVIYDTTEQSLYIGDGVTPGGVAASSFTFEDAQDAAASLFTSGIHSNISFSYNDVANRIDASINLNNYSGAITADAFQGSVYSDNSTLLLDGVLAAVNLDGTVRSDIIPAVDEAFDIGSPTSKFRDLYLSGSSLWIGNAQITSTNSSINLPAGSTVDGVSIGSGNGTGDGVVEGSNYRINIIGEDSSLIVDSDTGSVTAPGGLFGDLKGSVFGNDSSIIIDGNNGRINASGGLFGNLTTQRISSGDSSIIVVENITLFESDIIVQNRIIGDLTGSVYGSDSSFLIDSNTKTLTVNIGFIPDLKTQLISSDDSSNIVVRNSTIFESNLTVQNRIFGNLTGSIISGSGQIIYNQATSEISTARLFSSSISIPSDPNIIDFSALEISNQTPGTGTILRVAGNKNTSSLRLRRSDPGVAMADSDVLGSLVFEKEDTSGIVGYSVLRARPSSFSIQTSDDLGNLSLTRIIRLTREGLVGIGRGDPEYKLDVAGDARVTTSFTAGSFIQFGSLTTAGRNALTAVNGMVIYNSTNNKFEGYQNGAWINLDDGTAAGA